MLFQRILFPVDFSEAAVAMAPSVAAMASHCQASVTVLHAFHFAPDYVVAPRFHEPGQAEPAAIPYTSSGQELRARHAQHLEAFAAAHLEHVRWTPRIEDGDPALAIEWVARHEQTDLIMMPTRGIGRFRQMLLGSVTAKVLHDLACPVFTSAHAPHGAGAGAEGYRSIVCAVRLGPASEAALRLAGRFARAWQARLCLLHLDDANPPGKEADTVRSVQSAFAQAMRAEEPGGISTHVRILDGSFPEAIRAAAIEEAADLVVAGRGHLRGELARAWSHVYEIIRDSPCPVLSV